jgi:hypothetical protein
VCSGQPCCHDIPVSIMQVSSGLCVVCSGQLCCDDIPVSIMQVSSGLCVVCLSRPFLVSLSLPYYRIHPLQSWLRV